MKMYVPTICFLISILSGCDFSKKETPLQSVETKNQNAALEPANPPPLNSDCDFLGTSKPVPLQTWKMANGEELIICELFEARKISDFQYKGWFNLYKKSSNASEPIIKEVTSTKPSDSYSILIEKTSDSKISIKRILFVEDDLGESDVILTENELDCSKKKCELKPTQCSPQKAKFNDENIEIVQKIVGRKAELEEYGYYDVIIGDVINAAASGNKHALKLMLETPKSKLRVDGASAETYESGVFMLKTLRSLGCLK